MLDTIYLKRGHAVCADTASRPLTVDGMSDVLLPIAKAIGILVEQLESLVSANCQSTNISEESAELLAEAGHAALRHSRTLMHELAERRRDGRGARSLVPPGEPSRPEGVSKQSATRAKPERLAAAPKASPHHRPPCETAHRSRGDSGRTRHPAGGLMVAGSFRPPSSPRAPVPLQQVLIELSIARLPP